MRRTGELHSGDETGPCQTVPAVRLEGQWKAVAGGPKGEECFRVNGAI
jgi:hypothetical protein